MTALAAVLTAALAAYWVYAGYCLWAAWCWHRTPRARLIDPPPSVSILKPLCGADAEQLANLSSFCEQDYPEYEVLFGALDPEDPSLENARRVAESHPGVPVRIVAGGDAFGHNRKVCTLERLAAAANHEVFVLCDSDMRVEPDYLARVVAPLSGPDVGLVTCLYRGRHARGLAARLEALAIGCDFIPSVLLTRRASGLGFALGATIALRRETLEQAGGFRSLADELADDYRLGERVHRAGKKVVLSDYVVDDVMGREDFGAMWARRVRWAKTCRAMQPAGWAGAIVTHGLALAVALAAARSFDALGGLLCAATLLWRLSISALITGAVTRDREALRNLWLLPLSDLLSCAVWAASFVGSTVVWRGRRFKLGSRGRLEDL